MSNPLRFHVRHAELHSAFGSDSFGRSAEKFARAFGTPGFIIGQTLVVAAWIAINAMAIIHRWDPYPFILLNLMFSTQAAYAAPLILLAQTRQADRDKASETADAKHREELAEMQGKMIAENTRITEQIQGQTACLTAIQAQVTMLAERSGG